VILLALPCQAAPRQLSELLLGELNEGSELVFVAPPDSFEIPLS
jgi:hypothetical protein